jgi:hypothetical protein
MGTVAAAKHFEYKIQQWKLMQNYIQPLTNYLSIYMELSTSRGATCCVATR